MITLPIWRKIACSCDAHKPSTRVDLEKQNEALSIEMKGGTPMSVETTREVMMQYWHADDFSKIDENAVYTLIGTGQVASGREAIVQFLHDLYHVAFEAQASVKNMLIEDNKACFEAEFVGKQLREFAGIAPTGKEVRIPFCVVYDLANERITQARIYFETEVLR
jgi:predicted ester cyclase